MSTGAGVSFTVIRERLEAAGALTRHRGEHALMTSCPLHHDANPSLSVTWKARPGRPGGAVLLHCFSCGARADDITTALGLRMTDLFDEPADNNNPRRPRPAPPTPTPAPSAHPQPQHNWRQVRVYTYTSATGAPVQQVIRQECRCAGAVHKRFLQRYRHGRGWVWRKPHGFTPVLYRARQLQRAGTDEWIWLTEGEKDADNAAALGRTATTNPQGASSFPAALAEQLTGRPIAIIVDRDHAGYTRGLHLHHTLAGIAAHTQILAPAAMHHKADLTDHINARLWNPADPFGGLIITSPDQLHSLARLQAAQP